MCAQSRDRSMNESPVVANSSREQSRVLIFRLHDDAKSFKSLKVRGQRERDAWPTARKRRIGYCVLVELRNVADARIFDAPYFLWKLPRAGNQCRLRIDDPTIDSVGRAGRAEVRYASAVFDPAQQECVSVLEQRRASIENAVDWIRPVLSSQNGISAISREKRYFRAAS